MNFIPTDSRKWKTQSIDATAVDVRSTVRTINSMHDDNSFRTHVLPYGTGDAAYRQADESHPRQ